MDTILYIAAGAIAFIGLLMAMVYIFFPPSEFIIPDEKIALNDDSG